MADSTDLERPDPTREDAALEVASGHTRDALLGLVAKVSRAVGEAGRGDLGERLEQTRIRLVDSEIRVLVVGEFKQGKSKLINALVGAAVCPVDDDIATSVPTSVSYGEQPTAALLVRESEDPQAKIIRKPIPLEELSEHVSERGNPDNARGILAAEVRIPREILKGGLRLIDSPGVGGRESMRSLSTLSALSSAHAMLLVSDASQEYTDPEEKFIRRALRVSPNIAAVLSKTDIYPEWRTIRRIDGEHLDDIGHIPIFAVSSDLRLLAAEQRDRELNEESGFPDLVRHLRREVFDQADLVRLRGTTHDLISVVEQLAMAVGTELQALQNPEQTPELIAKLEFAQERAEAFRSRSSRWQVTLTDGISDLIADTEHDLRDRLRRVQREAEVAIDDGDPGPIWDQFTEWLEQRVSEAVSETFVWTNERQQWLAEEVAQQFAEDGSEIPEVNVGDTSDVLDPVDPISGIDPAQLSAGEKIYIGVRGSYGGVLMVGLATSLIGMSLINPLSLLAGVLVGRRAYKEDMSARLGRRQAEAKNNVRRYIDEVVFQVGKQLRDRLRVVQRVSRDHFGGLADELFRSLTDSVNAARQAASTFSADRDRRIAVLKNQLRSIEALRSEVPALEESPRLRSVEAGSR